MEQNMDEVSILKNVIRQIRAANTNENLFFGRSDNYKLYKTIFKGDEIADFKEMLLNTIELYLNNRSIEKYDLEVSCDDSIEIVDKEFVKEYEKLNQNVDNQCNIKSVSKETDFNKINFIYFKLEIPNTTMKIVILKKFLKPQTTFKKAIKVKLLGDKMERVNEDILYLDSSIVSFEYDGKFYIFDRNNFNSLFKFRDMYCKLIDSNSEKIRECDFIDNPDEFIEKCKNNGHFVKKISKVIIAQGFENIKANKDKIPKIIHDYGLKIVLGEKNKIVYEEEKTKEILDLLLDHYVKSALTDKKAIAKALDYEGDD